MDADAKRLSPTKDTIRELFGKCGNQCAFPGCRLPIIDAEGVFVAQMCHIEAAKAGAPRFNENQTNEERRHVRNLLLMCNPHHKVTDNVTKYPTEVMKEIKRKHEAEYLDAATKIWASIEDHTDGDEILLPTTLERFFQVEGVRPKNRQAAKETVHALAAMLKGVPGPTRELLLHSVRKATEPDEYGTSTRVLPVEVAQACGLSTQEVWDGVHILIRHDLVRTDDEYKRVYFIRQVGDLDDWYIFWALKTYCEETGTELRTMLVDLDFTVLD